jgi:hypothetical protein
MDSRTSQLETESREAVNAEKNGEPLQQSSNSDGDGQTSTHSKEQDGTDDVESGISPTQAEPKGEENNDELKGIRFALLFTCILLGSFFIGYVRIDPSQKWYSY